MSTKLQHTDREQSLIGAGLYSPASAARFIQVRSDKLSRWLGAGGRQPVLVPGLPAIDGHRALAFRDVVELLCVRQFREHGVSLQAIRKASVRAAEIEGTDRPFSTKRFVTDGRGILARVVDDDGEERLLDIVRHQYVFRHVFDPLVKQIEYDFDGIARRWWPLGRGRAVVIDPRRSFGAPISVPGNVPTAILYGAYLAGEREASIAKWYEVPLAAVHAAVEFERNSAPAQAA